ncbi:hypothetical protein CH354_07695 [Leptospira levettii]|uniref:hypothetical protein n=1 Tax=Leptospira levettii TaxID=2023178 RepID=UPI000CB280C2|nr:hypothetical protein [Leptospira levettii]PJZ36995.1 hypothetical protein CH354_07695 [Leptospira levettii]
MKQQITTLQYQTYIRIKKLLSNYDEINFSKRMIYIEDKPFKELEELMTKIENENSLVSKTKKFIQNFFKEWHKLHFELNKANQYRIEEEQSQYNSNSGFEFSSICHLYEFSCRIFRSKLQDYINYIENKFKLPEQTAEIQE